MHNTPQPRIALLIDADNAPAEKVDDILTELSTLGEISIRRIYGNWTKPHLSGWQSKLLDYALRPMQQFDYAKGKNATDMAMTVDAMELLYTERPNAFGIVSSDCDFTPLVMHLRAKGVQVYGFGADQTPKAFVNACSKFLYLSSLGEGDEDISMAQDESNKYIATSNELKAAPNINCLENTIDSSQQATKTAQTPTYKLRQDTRLMNLLRSAVQTLQDEDGWAQVSTLRLQIGNKASFDPRNYGYSNLKKLLIAMDEFDFRNSDSPQIAVRRKKIRLPAPAPAPVPSVRPKIELPPWPWKVPAVLDPQSAPPLLAELHGLRSVLIQLALRRTTVADVLLAAPEIMAGQLMDLGSVSKKLCSKGVVLSPAHGRVLLMAYPSSFRLVPPGRPCAVQYLV